MAHNASYIKVKIGSTDFIGELSSSLASAVDAIDVSSKATGRTRELLPGRVSENISFESLADDTNTTDYGYDDAHTAMAAGTEISFTIYRTDSADAQVNPSLEVTGDGFITSLTLDNPDNDRSTFSGTIEVNGELTVGNYTGGTIE